MCIRDGLWRGRTHWTMGVLGGVCFVLIGLLDEIQEHPPLPLQMLQLSLIHILQVLEEAGIDAVRRAYN